MRFHRAELVVNKDINEPTIDNEDNYLAHDETFVGLSSTRLINKLLDKSVTTDNQIDILLNSTRNFYRESLRYILQNTLDV